MTNLTHEFYRVPEEFISKFSHKEISRTDIKDCSTPLEIHDDIIRFIFRTLKWIKVRNYASKEDHDGLYYHGISIIYPDQIEIFHNIIAGWKCLFDHAPEIVYPNEHAKDITMKRGDVIEELNELTDFLIKIIKSKDCLIHSGI
jgi:hypothetical protein